MCTKSQYKLSKTNKQEIKILRRVAVKRRKKGRMRSYHWFRHACLNLFTAVSDGDACYESVQHSEVVYDTQTVV